MGGVPSASVVFACPVHKTVLLENFYCEQCQHRYPLVNGVPVLINDGNSVFREADYLTPEAAYGGASGYAGSLDRRTGLRQLYRKMMFRLSEAPPPVREFAVPDAVAAIRQRMPEALILVIGAGDREIGGNAVYTDVAFGKYVSCIADAHDLPFPPASFDACIACAVLEHVVDPYRCVDEIMRVLKPGGYVFAETPFMQPVHMHAYDFTRFTHLGHRRLFRHFAEICSGTTAGTGVSTAQIVRYALAALSDRPAVKRWLKMVGLIITYPLRWLDYVVHKNRSNYDAASGFYFFGTLQREPISDRELLTLFRGA